MRDPTARARAAGDSVLPRASPRALVNARSNGAARASGLQRLGQSEAAILDATSTNTQAPVARWRGLASVTLASQGSRTRTLLIPTNA